MWQSGDRNQINGCISRTIWALRYNYFLRLKLFRIKHFWLPLCILKLTLLWFMKKLITLTWVQTACMIEAYMWARAPQLQLQSLLFHVCWHITENWAWQFFDFSGLFFLFMFLKLCSWVTIFFIFFKTTTYSINASGRTHNVEQSLPSKSATRPFLPNVTQCIFLHFSSFLGFLVPFQKHFKLSNAHYWGNWYIVQMLCKFFTSLFPSEGGVVDSNWSEADKLAVT